MEKLNAKHKAVLSLCGVIKTYLDEIHEYAETHTYDRILDKIMKTEAKNETFYKYARIKIMTEEMNVLLESIKSIKLNSISDTRRAELSTELSKIQVKLNALIKEFITIDVANMDDLVADIIKDIDEEKIMEYRNFYHEHRGCINLYAYMMQVLIDNNFINNRILSFKLLALVEDDKNMALKGITHTQFNSKSKKNPIQYRYGLFPVTKLLPLKELLDLIFAELNAPTPKGEFAAIAKKLNIGIIILNKIVYTPVDFNPRPLIVEEDAKPYIQPNKFGINEKIITRFNTINQLKSTDKWNFSNEIYNESASKFFVLETIDGIHYKALAPWLQSDKYSMARFRVERIIHHNPVSRSVEYHTKKTELAIPNMFTKKMLDLESVDERKFDVDSNDIRNSIVDDIMRTISKIRESVYKNGFKNSTDVSNLLHEPEIINTYINSSLIHYAKGSNNYDGGDFKISEILASFLVMLQETGRRFSRELHNGYARDPLKSEIFTENKDKRDDIVMERILSIVERAMSLIIKLDSNPFVHIYTKYIKLNFDM
jgi:hypothetical protein